MRERFIELEKNTYEKRAFLYLILFLGWKVKLKTEKSADIIKEKAKLSNR